MGLSLWLVAMLAGVQDNPEPRLECAVPRDQLWDVSADFATWLLHVLKKGRSYEFLDSVNAAIARLPEPYGGPFKHVRDRALSFYVPPRTLDPEQKRAHVALERIELLKLLGGFEELVSSLESELARNPPMWEVLGSERVSQKMLKDYLAWARSALGDSPRFDPYGEGLPRFQWLRRQLAAGPDSKRRDTLHYDLFKALKAVGDPGAGHTLVTRLAKQPTASTWVKVEELQMRISVAHGRNDLVEVERLLGEIVATYKDAPQYPEKLLERAYLQVTLRRFPDALRSYETWMAANGDPTRAPEVQRAIGRIHVHERRWKEALETYVVARDKLRRRSFCGNCSRSMYIEDYLIEARCLA